ncbi:MAG: ABC transporter permease [Coriobacteriales bacterium]|jgi:NitT/TauT family transport system permease protein|nr:ABC transporter permease [Coriobacteriales bacterium]
MSQQAYNQQQSRDASVREGLATTPVTVLKAASATNAIETPGLAKRLRKISYRLFQLVFAIILFLGLWEICGRFGLSSNPLFLPPFSKVAGVLGHLLINGDVWKHMSISLQRSLSGFLLGVGFAVPLGMALGWNRKLEAFLNPLLQLFRNMPVLALLPVFVMFFGIGEVSKTAIIFWAVIWTVFISTVSGVKSIDPQLIKAAHSMGCGPFRLFRSIIFPAALPYIFTGIRLSAASSLLILVAAEMIGARQGLGYALYFYQANMMIPEMYAYLIIMAAVGLVVNSTLEFVEKRSFRWRDGV